MFNVSLNTFLRVTQIWDWTQQNRKVPVKEINEVYKLLEPDNRLATRKQKLERICKYFEETRDKVINNYYIMKHPEDALRNPNDTETSS